MAKKTLCLVAGALFAVSLAACGGAQKSDATMPAQPAASPAPDPAAAPAEGAATPAAGNPCSTGTPTSK
jgi:hypothetical protein